MADINDLLEAGLGAEGAPEGAEGAITPASGEPLTRLQQMSVEERKKMVEEVKRHYADWHPHRKKHESRWFVNGSFLRGQQHVEYSEGLAQLVTDVVPSYRVRLDLNRIRPKIRARLSKFFRGRPRPMVIPASGDVQDIQNAKATEKLLRYHYDRLKLEEKYRDARMWASITGKSFWWFYIDPTAVAQVKTVDEATGQEVVEDAAIGDVCVELGSAFEVLVQDPGVMRLGDQPAIQRVRMMSVEDVRQRFPEVVLPETGSEQGGSEGKDTNYVDRLATLRKDGGGGGGEIKRGSQLMVIEEYTAPCGKYPNGRKAVVVKDQLGKFEEELPYGMGERKTNPFPCVEFADALSPGQFWTTTVIEQLIDVQRQYNYLFELLAENIRACARPKFIVYRQHNLAPGAWSTAAGEIVELTYVPGLPAPIVLSAPNVAGDVWNLIAYYDRLFDEITQIYPASEGAVAKSTSGFQTNLLQEATDSVHAPDVREDELTIQEAAWKIRRLCKIWYDVPRLVSIMGENSLPEAMEFSQSQIDEHAEVRMQVGSMLPEMKAARAQSTLEFFDKGLFGDPADPKVRRKVLDLVDLGGMEGAIEDSRRDADEADRENQFLVQGTPVEQAQFYQDHITHVDRHQNLMKSPQYQQLAAEVQRGIVAHVIGHYDWVNPQLAQALRVQYQINAIITTPPPPPMMLGAPGGAPLGPNGPQAPPIQEGQAPPLPNAGPAPMPGPPGGGL